MQTPALSQKVNVIRTSSGTGNTGSGNATEINTLSGSLASVARIAGKGGLTNITLYTNQGCIARMLATLGDDLGPEVVNGVYRKIEEVTRLKSSETGTSDGQVDIQFTQPEIHTNILGGKITDEQIPPNAKPIVEFFRANSFPVILLILDKEGCPTKISSPFSYQEFLSEPHEQEALLRAELNIRANIERETGYCIREVYTKSANPAVPFATVNFVLDKVV